MSPLLKNLLPGGGGQATVVKQAKPQAKGPARPAKENILARWWRETESELKKVVWPTRKEWTNLTLAVVVTTVVMGVFLGILDFIFEQLIFLIVPR